MTTAIPLLATEADDDRALANVALPAGSARDDARYWPVDAPASGAGPLQG